MVLMTSTLYSEPLKVLIVGSGGREHALAWKAAQSPEVETVFVAPGNAGTASEPKVENVAIAAHDISTLVEFAKQQGIHLTIIGPEVALAAGIVDMFNQKGLRCFGPTKAAAQLESSKTFAKDFMVRHHIPTAAYQTFTDYISACAYIDQQKMPLVIKADGLAAGKGVIIAQTSQEAKTAAQEMLEHNKFGDAGKQIVIEQFLGGQEVTFIALTDGKSIVPFATAQDHKKRDNGDQGPNTGGMGAYSPVPFVSPELHERIMHTIIEPTIAGMKQEGIIYTGFLYAGLMISPEGDPYVLEFNCRLGDPEAQAIIMRLKSDIVELCNCVIDRNLAAQSIDWHPGIALTVVLASGGYPDAYAIGCPIRGLKDVNDSAIKVFHASTALKNGEVVTAGGRVLTVTALEKDILSAQKKVYQAVNSISWPDLFYRTDIGSHAPS